MGNLKIYLGSRGRFSMLRAAPSREFLNRFGTPSVYVLSGMQIRRHSVATFPIDHVYQGTAIEIRAEVPVKELKTPVQCCIRA
jgi:hypothetical protein